MSVNNPEILSPAGDFNNAIHAFKSGADAVYLGLTEFSARKRAKNFNLDELTRLKTFAMDNNKKIYVAINTLLTDEELKRVYPILKTLEEIEVDAIIVQDMGLAYIIKKYTTLTLHASTQLAVHNLAGMEPLKNLGFERVVLSRELSLKEITKIKKKYLEMELEIFIHGAMCYGFSGICMASSKLLGRSANRGECGQICRTWFINKGKKEFCFSLNDLNLEEGVIKLREIGIESLKIEGRMKGPSYAATTAALYRAILDGKPYRELQKLSRINFSRTGTDLYLEKDSSKENANLRYPGHTGLKIGKITKTEKNSFYADITEDINSRDGIMILTSDTPAKDIKLSVRILEKKGKRFKLAGNLPKNYQPELYKISLHDKHLKEERSTSYKPWKTLKHLNIELLSDGLEIEIDQHRFNYPLTVDIAQKPVDLTGQFTKVFAAGGETPYRFELSLINNSNIDQPFIPASMLKTIRTEFLKSYIDGLETPVLPDCPVYDIPENSYQRNRGEIPFIDNFKAIKIEDLIELNEKYLLPLTPVIFDSEQYTEELNTFLKEHNSTEFILGLNNISHITILQNIEVKPEYFIDYGLYSVNRYAKKLLLNQLPDILWFTKWVEKDNPEDYPPIFISRSCFYSQKHGCPEQCKKHFSYEITQNNRKERVVVRDCLTYTMIVENKKPL